MLKTIKDLLAFYVFLVVLIYAIVCFALSDTPTSDSLDCVRSNHNEVPNCQITNSYFLGLYRTIKQFHDIKEARVDSVTTYTKTGPAVTYNIFITDVNGNNYVLEHLGGEKDANTQLAKIDEYKNALNLQELHVANNKVRWIMIVTILSIAAFFEAIYITDSFWKSRKKRPSKI